MCYVFLLTALFSFMWCDKWVLHRQKHTHRKQRPEPGFDYSTIINGLFPEPWIIVLSFKPPPLPQPFSITAQWVPAFLILCISSSSPSWSGLKIGNGEMWAVELVVLSVQPWTSSSSITRELVGNANPWSPPQTQWIRNSGGGANYLHQPF